MRPVSFQTEHREDYFDAHKLDDHFQVIRDHLRKVIAAEPSLNYIDDYTLRSNFYVRPVHYIFDPSSAKYDEARKTTVVKGVNKIANTNVLLHVSLNAKQTYREWVDISKIDPLANFNENGVLVASAA